MYVDLEGNHELADFCFWNTINDSSDAVAEHKQKLMKAFKELSYYYKNSLLVQLESLEKSGGKRAQARKIQVIERYLFDESENESQDENEMSKPQYAAAAPSYQEEITPHVVDNRLQNKDYTALAELDKLIGLDNVKTEVRKLIALTEMARIRKQRNLKFEKQSLHMIFKGNPGTGKTTVARLLGKILHEIGVLSIGHVVELDRSNLISKYQGEIERKIVQYVEQAKGGILFIDEIYSLYHKGDYNDQGRQGIEVLLKVIEDKREDFVCIGAGYVNEINEFLGSNPGLLSRFAIHIDFEDYTQQQLLDIAMNMLEDRDYVMDDSFKKLFHECILDEKHKANFGNARVVRNIIESSIREQSLRLFTSNKELSEKDLTTICAVDFHYKPVQLPKTGGEESQ